jgi:hypothetical protein
MRAKSFRGVVGPLLAGLMLGVGQVYAENGDSARICNKVTNLLSNPTFVIAVPRDWLRDAFAFSDDLFLYDQGRSGYQQRHKETGEGAGKNYNKGNEGSSAIVGIAIPVGKPNDARWVQEVTIEPYQTYILSGWIKTKDVGHTTESIDVGANLSVLGWGEGQGVIDIYSEPLFDTNGWTYREVQFNSGPHTKAAIALRVGFFAGTTTGTAWFRDIKLQKAP